MWKRSSTNVPPPVSGTNPEKQGLKHHPFSGFQRLPVVVSGTNPEKQGLKLADPRVSIA